MAAALAMLAGALYAQDYRRLLARNAEAGRDFRLIVEITRGEHGAWNAIVYSIGRGPDGVRASSVTLERSTVRLAVDATGGDL